MSGRGLRLGGRIDRYVSLIFVSSYATAFFVVVGLFLVLDMAGNLDEFVRPMKDGSTMPTGLIARFYLMNMPFLFLQVAPFVTLVAGLFTVSKLLKHNEIVACLAAGISAHRLLLPVIALGALAGGVAFQLREVLARGFADQRDALRYVLEEKTWDRVCRHLWIKDLDGRFVHLFEFRPATGQPERAEVSGLEAVHATSSRVVTVAADRASWIEREGRPLWVLEGGKTIETSRLDQSQRVAAVTELHDFDFTPALALTTWRAREAALELSFSEARELSRRDPDNVAYQTLLQYHVTFPLANLVLLLVGLPLLMQTDRRSGARGLAYAGMLCLFYFSTEFVFRNLGVQGALDPVLAAWIPVLFFGSLGIALYEFMRT